MQLHQPQASTINLMRLKVLFSDLSFSISVLTFKCLPLVLCNDYQMFYVEFVLIYLVTYLLVIIIIIIVIIIIIITIIIIIIIIIIIKSLYSFRKDSS